LADHANACAIWKHPGSEIREVTRAPILAPTLQLPWTMQGLLTERNLPAAEETFPGIGTLYETLRKKPRTFLELVWIYEAKRPKRK
jgi:hypothetical protein